LKVGLRARLFGSTLVLLSLAGIGGNLLLKSRLQRSVNEQLRTSACQLATEVARMSGRLAKHHPAGLEGYAASFATGRQPIVRLYDRNGRRLGHKPPRGIQATSPPLRSKARILSAGQCAFEEFSPGPGQPRALRTTAAMPGSATQNNYAGHIELESSLALGHQVVHQLRQAVIAAILLTLLIVLLGSEFALRRRRQTLQNLIEAARGVSQGTTPRIEVTESGELGQLARSINELAGDLQQSIERLEGQKEQLHAVLQSMDEAVVAIDGRNRIALANHAARKALQLTGVEQSSPLESSHLAPELTQLIRTCTAEGASSRDITLGTDKSCHARATPLASGGGVVLVMFETTELRRLERMRSDFVANVSHELRTPVSVMLANAETLLDGGLDNEQHALSFAQAIARSAKRLTNLLSDLLDLARVEAGEYKLTARRLDARDAVLASLNDIVTVAESRKTSFEVTAAEELAVVADPAALQQILSNLLSNAVKHAPQGGKVSVRTMAKDQGIVRFEVSDNGPGVPVEHRSRVFERFYRIDGGRSRDIGGTGLGLSIVKNLVELMDGQVGVSSSQENGALFWVELKAAPRS
jgi:two-component system, OmpR family, phosphate regulon sensor histidine kinase PhoR